MGKATKKRKGGKRGLSVETQDDGLRPDDRKLLNSFIRAVEEHLWNVDQKDRETSLRDLRDHIVERSKRWNVDNALEMSIYSTGSPEVLAKGIRTLYGYSTGFKAFLVVFVLLLAIPTVPLFKAWAIMSLMVLFLVISNFAVRSGRLIGGLMGFAAAVSRGVMVVALALGRPDVYMIGSTQALMDFMLVSMFLILVGLLAGHIREASQKAFLRYSVH